MATLAKPKSQLVQRPQGYREVGGASPAVKAMNGIGKQISTNNTILHSIANSLMRRRNVEQKIQTSLYNDLERRRKALKKLNSQKKRPQLVAENLQRQRKIAATAKPSGEKKEEREKEEGGLGFLNGLVNFFRIIGGKLLFTFIAGAAFKWLSNPQNAKRFADAFKNFYNLVLKPLGKFLFNWATWVLESAGTFAGGLTGIISGIQNGELGSILTGFGDVFKSLPAIASIGFLLNPAGSLALIWNVIRSIGSIAAPPQQRGGADIPGKKPPTGPQKPNWFRRLREGAGKGLEKTGRFVLDQTGRAGRAIQRGARGAMGGLQKLGQGFRQGLVNVGQGLNGIKDAAMRKLVEPAIEFVRPLMNKLGGLKKTIEKKLMDILGPQGKAILKNLGGKGSQGLMKRLGSKAIPILGGLANLYFAYEALKNGDPIGALLEFTSAAFDLVGLVPGGQWGPFVSLGIDAYSLIRGMVPGIKDKENSVVNGLGLGPIMEQIKKFGGTLPGAESGASGRPANMDAYDPRSKSGSYFVGALFEILDKMPGGEILKSAFENEILSTSRVFGRGIISLSESPVVASITSTTSQIKTDLNNFFDQAVAPVKNALTNILGDWWKGLQRLIPNVRSAPDPVRQLLGLGTREEELKATFDPSKNYGMRVGDQYRIDADTFAERTDEGVRFYKGGAFAGIPGTNTGRMVGGTLIDISEGRNQSVVDKFLAAKSTPSAPDAGSITKAGQKGEIYLHWTAGSKTSTYGGYHTVITGDGQVHRKADYANRGRAHTAYRNSRGVGIAVAAMAGPNGGPYDWANPVQYASMAQEVANLAKAWGWSKDDINIKNVMTHAEAAAGKDGRLHLHRPPMRGAKKNPDNYGPTQWGGDGSRWDLMRLTKGGPNTGGDQLREMIKQRMNYGGIVKFARRRLGDGEDNLHKNIAHSEERHFMGGIAAARGIQAARNPGAPMINNRSVLDPGITRSSVEITAVQRVVMPIPTPMPADAGGGIGGSRSPSPLSTFGRS